MGLALGLGTHLWRHVAQDADLVRVRVRVRVRVSVRVRVRVRVRVSRPAGSSGRWWWR